MKASRVDKLQVELNTQRERLEEGSRLSAKFKDLKTRYDTVLEAKAKLEDEVDSLQSKISLLGGWSCPVVDTHNYCVHCTS